MYNTDHYAALNQSLINEKARLAQATTAKEIAFRLHNISMIEKEMAQEAEFLKNKGVDVYHTSSVESSLSDDDILNELFGE